MKHHPKTIQYLLQCQREEIERQKLAGFIFKLFLAHITIVTIFLMINK